MRINPNILKQQERDTATDALSRGAVALVVLMYDTCGDDLTWCTDDDRRWRSPAEADVRGGGTSGGGPLLQPLCSHLYTGRYYDAETGLYDYRQRMYHPGLGRFLQPDPIGHAGGTNLYQYVAGRPNDAVDPHGELWSWLFAGAGAIVGAIIGGVGYLAFGWMAPEGYTWGGFGGAVAGGAVSGAVVGGIVGMGTGDPSFLAAVGLGTTAGVTYGLTESIVRQQIDQGAIDWTEVGIDTAIGGGIGAVTGGLGVVLRQPARTLGRRFGRIIPVTPVRNIDDVLRAGSRGGIRRNTLAFLKKAEAARLRESGVFGGLGRLHNRLQVATTWEGSHSVWRTHVRTVYSVHDGLQLHHGLIPRNQWGRYVPNYIKNLPFMLTPVSRSEHVAVDLAIRNSATRYPALLRGWFGSPPWLRQVTSLAAAESLGSQWGMNHE